MSERATVAVESATRGTMVGVRIRIARSLGERTVGLLKTPGLEQGEGLWIEGAPSIHMFFMKYPIDAVFVDGEGRVTKIVPNLKPWRVVWWARGYNQATLVARELSRLARLPLRDVLVRVRPTTKQHRLNRSARLANLRGAFAVAPGIAVPRTAILVDDILTTSATLEACASVLADAGCEAAYGFAIAREV